MNTPKNIKRSRWKLNEDNLVVLQLIGNWEHETHGESMPEPELEIALRKDGFQWDINRMYQSILELTAMKVINIKNERCKTEYQINHEVFYLLLNAATEEFKGETEVRTELEKAEKTD